MTSQFVTSTLVMLVQIAVLGGVFLLARRFMRSKRRLGSAGPIVVGRDGSATIPVFATFTGLKGLSPWIAIASNNLNPLLRFGPLGMEFKVIWKRAVEYANIASVEVRTGPGTVNLCFVFNDSPFTFSANVGDEASAGEILPRLPQSVSRGPLAKRLERPVALN